MIDHDCDIDCRSRVIWYSCWKIPPNTCTQYACTLDLTEHMSTLDSRIEQQHPSKFKDQTINTVGITGSDIIASSLHCCHFVLCIYTSTTYIVKNDIHAMQYIMSKSHTVTFCTMCISWSWVIYHYINLIITDTYAI